jgi:hypothetical protein
VTTTVPDIEAVARAVELACRAPSLYNSQPWRWVADGEVVDLFVDPGRVIRSSDSSGREAIIGCGAALHHFHVAMTAAGWNTHMDRFPNPNNLDHLATIHFTPLDYISDARRRRADAILRRRTDRLPFRAPREWRTFELVLHNLFINKVVALDVLPNEARAQLAKASGITEILRGYDDIYQLELHWWTASSRLAEGIPQSSLVSESERQRVGVNRQFPDTGPSERRVETISDEAKILVLSTPEDTRSYALDCGEALSALLLECTMAGLATCPLTHITEMAPSRDIIRDLTAKAAMPQVLIRVGTAPVEEPPAPTPRRPVTDVLEIRR